MQKLLQINQVWINKQLIPLFDICTFIFLFITFLFPFATVINWWNSSHILKDSGVLINFTLMQWIVWKGSAYWSIYIFAKWLLHIKDGT